MEGAVRVQERSFAEPDPESRRRAAGRKKTGPLASDDESLARDEQDVHSLDDMI